MVFFLSIVLTGGWLLIIFWKLSKLASKKIDKQQLVYLGGYFLLDECKLEQKLAFIIQHLHINFMLLESLGWDYKQTKHKLAVKLGELMIILVVGSWIAYFSKENALYLILLISILVLLVQIYQGTLQKVKQRRQSIILELPLVLTKMTLYIEAGETIKHAFIRCISDDNKASKHPLHQEWNIAITMLKNGESFPLVIEKFSKRCSVQPISVLCTYLLLNYARGGSYFVTSVQDLMDELWEQRKTIARKKGEEASSKLIFPTILILLLLMVLIITPAIRLIDII